MVTLPLLAGLLAGTALGHALTHNTGLVYTGAGISCVVALLLGSWFWFGLAHSPRETDAACLRCAPALADERSQEQVPLQADRPAPGREK